jgi:AraC-like DNA-binding protein
MKEEFRVIQPSPLLAPYIKHYWLLKTAGHSEALARTVPTGMMSLIFHRGNRLLSVYENALHPRAFLSGQESTFADLKYSGGVDMISVVFHPVGVRAFFSLPINKLAGLRLTAGDIEDKELAVLENSLTSTEDDKLCILLIEQFLLKRLTRLADYNLKRIDMAIGLINSGEGDAARLAEATCLSGRQFYRIFSEHVGANPKEFSRTIRFQRALHILENNPQLSLTDLAYNCGYFDQSHMIKDFKAFSGYAPSEFLAACSPHSDYFG